MCLLQNVQVVYADQCCLKGQQTDVDQHFKSDQGMSQLSLAIFIVSGTHRKPQKSFIL